jgi:ubiquinone/menaquinone biosynthesis C-methylase UbiE
MRGWRIIRSVAPVRPEEIAMTTTERHTEIEPRGSWFSATTYDFALRGAEKAGMAERRRKLVSSARGSVLELGAGTGLNLAYYPAGLERLVICEPEPHMFKHLRKRAEKLGSSAELVQAQAEALPFEDDSFDTVVGTLVFCTIGDPRRALEEVRRVLRPSGSLLFLEHVRSDSPRLARWQDRLSRPWGAFAEGCRCNQATVELLREAGFAVTATDATWKRMPPIVRPLASGQASPDSMSA